MIPTSLGRIIDNTPGSWFRVDTSIVLDNHFSSGMIRTGHPWVDSPIFDRLAGERFGW